MKPLATNTSKILPWYSIFGAMFGGVMAGSLWHYDRPYAAILIALLTVFFSSAAVNWMVRAWRSIDLAAVYDKLFKGAAHGLGIGVGLGIAIEFGWLDALRDALCH